MMAIFKELNEGDQVFVYFNLHKKTFSVKNISTGLVVAHLNFIRLKNATFKVSQKGREQVLREKRKNVHAGVVGFFTFNEIQNIPESRATYNPYKYDSFVDEKTFEKIEKSEIVFLEKLPQKTSIFYQSRP